MIDGTKIEFYRFSDFFFKKKIIGKYFVESFASL